MFVTAEGRRLGLDRAFTLDGINYPANWLRLTSLEEKAQRGITEAPSTPANNYDQKFFWGPNNPKDHAQLVENWVSKVKATAGSMLAQTDWMVIRAADPSSKKALPKAIKAERTLIREKAVEKEDAILATSNTEELAAYVKSPGFSEWVEVAT